ncbi:thioredoxin [Natrinema halophilum]|uniref:Thioredoxin n=1 Tax=Natrinema halophilum TaxID=1699371 RepID=A0A7D5GMC5_9EURY|nr:thioredoxin [Natrinema halophilum]QLG48393.1 thioredoxin [Natrinema halophilum]
MTEDETLEEIRQQKLERLRSRTTEADAEETTRDSPSEPFPVQGSAELTETVNDHDVVLVDFHADWCGPCQMLEPVVETIAADTQAAVAKVDIDANQQLATEYGVRGVPTLVLFANGQPAERLVGMQTESQLRSVVESHL